MHGLQLASQSRAVEQTYSSHTGSYRCCTAEQEAVTALLHALDHLVDVVAERFDGCVYVRNCMRRRCQGMMRCNMRHTFCNAQKVADLKWSRANSLALLRGGLCSGNGGQHLRRQSRALTGEVCCAARRPWRGRREVKLPVALVDVIAH